MDYNNEIVAKVKFNEGFAYVFRNQNNIVYYRFGDTIIGTDGIFYHCLFREVKRGAQSFAGRKITWVMNDGEVIVNDGTWWDGISNDARVLLPENIGRVTLNDVHSLRQCYVYWGGIADIDKLNELLAGKDLQPYEYREFETLLKAVKPPKFKSRVGSWLEYTNNFLGVTNQYFRKGTVRGKIYFTPGGFLDDNFRHINYPKDATKQPYLITF